MDFLDRLRGTYSENVRQINSRRGMLLSKIGELIPVNVESAAEYVEATGDLRINLSWVQVPDPRPGMDKEPPLEVRPVLEVGSVTDGSGFSMMPGVTHFLLMGRRDDGSEQLIASMDVSSLYEDPDMEDEPLLDLSGKTEWDWDHESRSMVIPFTPWDTPDAELFLTLAEAALQAQPALTVNTKD